MKTIENERRDWIIVLVIILFGFLCVLLAAGWAIRFSPSWKSNADMGSILNPNSDFTNRPNAPVEALDPAILTQPAWINLFLTPGASVPTRIPITETAAPEPSATPAKPTASAAPISSPTNTLTYIFFTSTAAPKPTSTKTPAPLPTSTSAPAGSATATSTVTPTFTAAPQADLQITITDNATTYDINIPVQYTILVSNPSGPSGVISAVAAGTFSPNLTNITWSCIPSGGATCGTNTGPFGDIVDLPVGSSITYTVNATVSSANGDLISMVNISPPAGITDPVPANNSATDTDTLIVPDPTPLEIGSGPDNNIYVVGSGTILTLQLSTPIIVNGGNDGWDLVYYEWPQGSATTTPGIWMDCVVLQVSDGKNWYTILNWGDNNPDTNASMNMNTVGAGAETDNLVIDAAFMYNATGIAIELDKVIPNGTYKYFRIISPPPPLDNGDGAEIDGITILP